MGSERLDEIENPEIAAKRMREIYKAKGYSDEWIEKRVRGIAVRDELTNEWKKRGVKEQTEYKTINVASGKVMEKAGMKHEGVLREHYKQGDGYLDISTKSILISEYMYY